MKSTLLILLLAFTLSSNAQSNDAPLVAVASSLRYVWSSLMDKYPSADLPRVTFGSSGNLARQITQGAPFQLFLSADDSFPKWLRENGITNQEPVEYLEGKLVWVTKPGTPLAIWLLNDFGRNIGNPVLPEHIKRLAIANPRFAPYGVVAEQVLEVVDTNSSVKLTLGENAVQALQFSLSGATDGGIVPKSLVSETARKKLPDLITVDVDTNLYSAVKHTMVFIGEPDQSTQFLFDFLLSETALFVFTQNGFDPVSTQ